MSKVYRIFILCNVHPLLNYAKGVGITDQIWRGGEDTH